MKRIEQNWTARTFPDTPVTPAAVLSSPSGSSVESSWEIHVATLLFAFYWIMRKFKIVFLLYYRGRLFLFSCFSFHFPTLFMAINCIILQCLKWMFWHRIMGWIYAVSCEAIWCLSHLKKRKKKVILPKFHLVVVGLSPQLQVLGIVSYASRTRYLVHTRHKVLSLLGQEWSIHWVEHRKSLFST